MESLMQQLDIGRLVTQVVEFIPSLMAALLLIGFFWLGLGRRGD